MTNHFFTRFTAIALTIVISFGLAVSVNAQARLADGSPTGIAIQTPQSQPAPPSFGGLTFFGDRPTFDAAAPGLPIEDWQDFDIGAGGALGCDAPANSGTSCPGAYVPGDILPGLELRDDIGPDVGGLVALGSGFNGNASIQFGSNTFVDALVVLFSPAVDAAGLDIACHFSPGTANIDVFDGGGGLLGSTTSGCSNAGTFFGVTSVTPIGSIRIFDPNNQAELIDNVAFGDTGGGCDLHAIVHNAVVSPGGLLGLDLYLQHNRDQAVTRRFIIELRDANEVVVYRRSTAPLTIHQYSELRRSGQLRMPTDIQEGNYTLTVHMTGMAQGTVVAEESIRVVKDASTYEDKGNGQLDFNELLDGQWEAVAQVADISGTHTFAAAYPNPFNPEATFTFAVNADQVVQAELVDMLGRVVATLYSGNVAAGELQTVRVDGSNLPSGMYLIRIAGETFSDVQRVTLLK